MNQFRKEVKGTKFYSNIALIGAFFIGLSFFGIFGMYATMMLVGIVIFVIHLVNTIYEARVDQKLSVENKKRKIRLYPGDTDELRIPISQNGIWPLLGAKLVITYDQVIETDHGNIDFRKETAVLEERFSVFGKETKEIVIPFKAMRRGIARIRSVEIALPYIFGYGRIHLRLSEMLKTEVIVYPEITSVSGIEYHSRLRSGDYFAKHSIYEHPIISYGTREYLPGDPFNRVHWKATAKKQELQTKIFEKVSQRSWLLLYNIRGANGPRVTDELERDLGHISYLAMYATANNIPFQLMINMPSKGIHKFINVPVGSGKTHYLTVLETLARIHANGLTVDFSRVLQTAKNYADYHPFIFHVGFSDEHHLAHYRLIQNMGTQVFNVKNSKGQAWIESAALKEVVAK